MIGSLVEIQNTHSPGGFWIHADIFVSDGTIGIIIKECQRFKTHKAYDIYIPSVGETSAFVFDLEIKPL